jgi:S-adenosylmethionine synthetase
VPVKIEAAEGTNPVEWMGKLWFLVEGTRTAPLVRVEVLDERCYIEPL